MTRDLYYWPLVYPSESRTNMDGCQVIQRTRALSGHKSASMYIMRESRGKDKTCVIYLLCIKKPIRLAVFAWIYLLYTNISAPIALVCMQIVHSAANWVFAAKVIDAGCGRELTLANCPYNNSIIAKALIIPVIFRSRQRLLVRIFRKLSPQLGNFRINQLANN